ncbi:helix-turn-helix domain-containing protein [Sphingomonas pokkalii]|uniref:XRE family transcriptional regulator n=1 Tax=Sphingomonas pokkalii TaxID=2175090 RepID=A0A2U0SFU1_9SPHN|nr:helix-turn-helix transcriptional regulator [Sphingomonas pokkalii]PVX30223.1 XRE family transcriptional regulator [Sphingomonas pokkalii]
MGNQKSAAVGLQRTVAENLKERRLRLGLSQEEFAEVCGYHRTYIGSIERAERNITLSTLDALARALNVPPNELLRENNG